MQLRPATAARLFCALSLAPAAAAQLGDVPETSDRLGSALVRCDLNVDGIDDLAIGVPGEGFTSFGFPFGTTAYTAAGAVHLVYGNPSGLSFATSKLLKQPQASGSVPGIGSGNAFGSALATPDFDGDGFLDLAVGIPGQKIGASAGAGAAQVFFLAPAPTLKLVPGPVFHQDHPGLPDAAEAADAFGASLCAGDFDADGFVDLAVGAPTESFGTISKTGVVHAIHGAIDGGLHPLSSFWVQGKGGLPDAPESGDLFGQSLAAGDLNADGFDDLAVGAPEEDLAFVGAGAVHVIYGSALGLQPAGNQLWHQDSPGIAGDAEADDNFGAALAIGDLDLDGIGDLSIGVPGDTIAGFARAGSLDVLFGTPGGLSSADNLQISQLDFSPFLETPESNDRFGACLGLHADDGFVQIVVGVPGESFGLVTGAGTLQGFGVMSSFRQVGSGFTMSFFMSPPEKGAALGSAFTTGDVNGDGHVDYGIGVPQKDFGAKDAGEVVIVLVAAAPFQEVLHQGN